MPQKARLRERLRRRVKKDIPLCKDCMYYIPDTHAGLVSMALNGKCRLIPLYSNHSSDIVHGARVVSHLDCVSARQGFCGYTGKYFTPITNEKEN